MLFIVILGKNIPISFVPSFDFYGLSRENVVFLLFFFIFFININLRLPIKIKISSHFIFCIAKYTSSIYIKKKFKRRCWYSMPFIYATIQLILV